MKNFYKREMKQKAIEDFFSVKTWSVFLATALLLEKYLTGGQWVTVITTALSLREIASYRYESNTTQVETNTVQPKVD